MKRSEMVERISDLIENAFPDVSEDYCKLVAESILDMQKFEGMLPPAYKKLLYGETEYRNARSYTTTEEVTGQTFYVTETPNWVESNEWETE